MSDIGMMAKGRWRSILPALGVSADHLVNKGGPCPMCGGKDRFRFDDKDGRGTFYCNQCGPGDGFKLLMEVRGWSFREAAAEVERVAGLAPVEVAPTGPDPEEVRRRMAGLWKCAQPLGHVDACRAWWMRRAGEVPTSGDLRGVEELFHPESKRRFPGQLALVRGPDGEVVNLHRTWLTNAGAKAPVGEARMVMPLELPPGSAIQLFPVTDRIGIAEGIETAYAATLLTGIPCWAAMTATNMARWVPPADVAVTIFGDNDDSFTGFAAAGALAKRLRSQGRAVDVQIPGGHGQDWADVWALHLESQAAA